MIQLNKDTVATLLAVARDWKTRPSYDMDGKAALAYCGEFVERALSELKKGNLT